MCNIKSITILLIFSTPVELRSKSERRHGNPAPGKTEFWRWLQGGRISPLVTPCCFSLFFLLSSSSSPPRLSYLFWNTLQLHRVPSPRTMCSQTTQPRTPIQMKSVLQLLQSWDHFTSACQILKKKKDYNKSEPSCFLRVWKGFESAKIQSS